MMVSALLPIVIILTMAYLRMVNQDMEEAGMLYCSWPEVLRRITLPLISPGIALGALITFVITLGEFGVPSFLRFDVYSVESFTRFSAFYDFNSATAAAVPLGIITIVVLIIERFFLRRKAFVFRTTGMIRSEKEMAVVPLGKSKIFLHDFCKYTGAYSGCSPLVCVAVYKSSPFLHILRRLFVQPVVL